MEKKRMLIAIASVVGPFRIELDRPLAWLSPGQIVRAEFLDCVSALNFKRCLSSYSMYVALIVVLGFAIPASSAHAQTKLRYMEIPPPVTGTISSSALTSGTTYVLPGYGNVQVTWIATPASSSLPYFNPSAAPDSLQNPSAGGYTWLTHAQDIGIYNDTGGPASYSVTFSFLQGQPDLSRLVLIVAGLRTDTTATVSQSGILAGEYLFPISSTVPKASATTDISGGTILSNCHANNDCPPPVTPATPATDSANTGWALFQVKPATILPGPNPSLTVQLSQGYGDGIGVTLGYVECVADAGPDRTVCCCGPVKMQIGSPAVAGVTYSWSPTIGLDDPSSSSPTIDFSIFNGTSVVFPSVYEVTATDSFGCSSKDSVFIKTVCSCRPPAKVSIARPNSCSRTFTLTADCACGDTTPTYLWTGAGTVQTTQSITVPAGSGPYTVTCRNECGATLSQPITVPPVTLLEGGLPSIQCPNVLTPNGDNVNDFWVALDPTLALGATPAYNATDYQFEVFNRWGNRVAFLSGSTTTGFANGSIPHWDGTATESVLYSWWQHLWGKKDTNAGQPVSDGTYYYILRMKNCTTGWTDVCVGDTSVLR